MENTLLLATVLAWRKNSLHNLLLTERQNLFNAKFLGSKNFQASALKDQFVKKNWAVCKKEHKEAVVAGRSLPPRKVEQHAPSNSPLVQGIQLMGYLKHDTVKKLHEIDYYIALKGQLISNFKEQWQLQYDNACKNFIFSMAEYFFEENIKNKLIIGELFRSTVWWFNRRRYYWTRSSLCNLHRSWKPFASIEVISYNCSICQPACPRTQPSRNWFFT